jgi:hypothetical protein
MCWTTPISTTSSGGSSSAPAIRNATEVWYDWSRVVRTTKSCASAAQLERTRNAVQRSVCASIFAASGTAAARVAARITRK